MIVKLWVGGSVIGLLASAIGDLASAVMLGGGALMMMGAGMRFGWRRVVKPLLTLAPALERLPEWMEETDVRLDKGHEDFEEIRTRLGGLEELASTAAVASAAAAMQAEKSTGLTRAVARHVGAQVRGEPPYPEGE